jgi:organic hydroperoxide reductase OsmC/OhrA
VLVIRRIHVTYHLKLEAAKREVAERVHEFHADFCPVARTFRGCIEVSTSLGMEDA